MGIMIMNRELAASCLMRVKWSHIVGPSGTTYGCSRVVAGWEDPVSSPPPVSDPSNRVTWSCRRSWAMSRISWLRRASAFACTHNPPRLEFSPQLLQATQKLKVRYLFCRPPPEISNVDKRDPTFKKAITQSLLLEIIQERVILQARCLSWYRQDWKKEFKCLSLHRKYTVNDRRKCSR